jgi:hypothetical protein
LANNQPVPKNQDTVPLSSFSGTFTTGPNAYNGSNQYNYAAKHNPQVFFSSTDGGNNGTPSNPLAANYAPLQQLATDLTNNTVAQYNWITPDQYNDMHSTLTGGFAYHGVHYTGDQAAIAQGDNFLSLIVPMIEASQAYRNDGTIILWRLRAEDDPGRTLGEIIISPDAKGNAYTNNRRYTHSSDLLPMQEIYGVGPCLRDACNATDRSDLFKVGSIPTGIPEPSTLSSLALGLGVVTFATLTFRNKRGSTLKRSAEGAWKITRRTARRPTPSGSGTCSRRQREKRHPGLRAKRRLAAGRTADRGLLGGFLGCLRGSPTPPESFDDVSASLRAKTAFALALSPQGLIGNHGGGPSFEPALNFVNLGINFGPSLLVADYGSGEKGWIVFGHRGPL